MGNLYYVFISFNSYLGAKKIIFLDVYQKNVTLDFVIFSLSSVHFAKISKPNIIFYLQYLMTFISL